MALLRKHEAIEGKFDVFRVNPRLLKIEPGFNVRDLDAPSARAALDELKEQVREFGVQVPIEVRQKNDDLIVVSGHRRHKVVMELISEGAEIESIPAIAEPKTVSEDQRVARLITMNAGEPLTTSEKAEVVRRLLVHGWDRAKIARTLGFKSVQALGTYEELLGAPAAIREAVRNDEISASAAVEMVRADGDAAEETLSAAREDVRARGGSRITPAAIKRTRPTVAQNDFVQDAPDDGLPVRQIEEQDDITESPTAAQPDVPKSAKAQPSAKIGQLPPQPETITDAHYEDITESPVAAPAGDAVPVEGVDTDARTAADDAKAGSVVTPGEGGDITLDQPLDLDAGSVLHAETQVHTPDAVEVGEATAADWQAETEFMAKGRFAHERDCIRGLRDAFCAPGDRRICGAELADGWPDDEPLCGDDITKIIDELMAFESRFRSQHGAGNAAALEDQAA